MANDQSTTIPQLASVMMKDAGMAAKMLRLVNSAAYAVQEPVTSLEQALAMLGMKTIRTIALSISVISLFQQEQTHFNMKAFWFHNAVAAGMCKTIANLSKVCDPEMAFTFGLLKDIGKVLMVENAPLETRAIIAVASEYKLSFTDAARKVVETDDVEIAAWLCQHWELDTDLVNAIRYQNDLVRAGKPAMTAMAMLVENLCYLRKIRMSGCFDEPVLNPAVWQHLGLDKSALKTVIDAMTKDMESARELMTVVS
jgi:HD-like signal output (HDOD) protein